MNILEQFKHEETFLQMTMGEKLIGTFYTILLGMAVTFIALIIIMYLTKFMSFVIGRIEKRVDAPVVKAAPVQTQAVQVETATVEEDDEELIAVITAAVAASLNTSMHNIVVTNITRVSDNTPTWGKLGRSDVMSSRM